MEPVGKLNPRMAEVGRDLRDIHSTPSAMGRDLDLVARGMVEL